MLSSELLPSHSLFSTSQQQVEVVPINAQTETHPEVLLSGRGEPGKPRDPEPNFLKLHRIRLNGALNCVLKLGKLSRVVVTTTLAGADDDPVAVTCAEDEVRLADYLATLPVTAQDGSLPELETTTRTLEAGH